MTKTGAVRKYKNTRILKWSMLVVCVVAMFIALWFMIEEKSIERVDMANYLKSKYQQDFVVGKPERRGSGLGVEGYSEYTVYPKGNRNLVFIAVSSSSSKSDDYPGVTWSSQEYERLKPVMGKLLSNATYSIKIRSAFSLQTKDINIKGNVPSFSDAANKYGNKIPYTLTVKDYVGSRLSDDQKLKIVGVLLKLSNYIPKNVDSKVYYITEEKDNQNYGIIVGVKEIVSSKDNPNILLGKFRKWGK